MIFTEMELRENWHKTKGTTITLPEGSVLTPLAQDFIRSKGIQIKLKKNKELVLKNAFLENDPNCEKPEQMTHLYKDELVSKNHPIIALRGQLDLFQTLLVDTQLFFLVMGEQELVEKLEEVALLSRNLMVAEVKGEPFEAKTLWGLTLEEIRGRSHYPNKYYGVSHTPLSYTHGLVVNKIQQLRAKIREVELYANRAFTDDNGDCSRIDIIQALNRLSSAFYILACEMRGKNLCS